MSDFIARCQMGEVLLDEIDDFIGEWHESDSESPIYEFLGMTRSEYFLWLKDTDILPFIVKARRGGFDLEENLPELIKEIDTLPIAARSDGAHQVAELLDWVRRTEP